MIEATTDFKSLGLSQEILNNLVSLDYLKMTPIQEKSLPFILKQQDVIGQANTGSGKTAAFALGILSKVDITSHLPQSLVVVPTRELAEQVSNEIRRLARFSSNVKVITLSGGAQERHKVKSLKQGAHIIVGTPGRLLKLLEKKVLIAYEVNTLVLDEADRLLEVGSINEINRIASFTRADRQTMLFSATFPQGIKKLSAGLQEDAVQITIDSQHQSNNIDQVFYKVEEDKNAILLRVYKAYCPDSCIIFCNSRESCNKLSAYLKSKNMNALVIHSDLEQKDRVLTLIKFKNKSCPILIATDMASRGLDVKDVGAIINFDLPKAHESYVHRIGRTGRANSQGLAISLYMPNEIKQLNAIEGYLKTECLIKNIDQLDMVKPGIVNPELSTLYISGGKKNSIRPGDILGALTKDAGLDGAQVGKIDVLEINSYVAIDRTKVDQAIAHFKDGKIKGKKFKVGLA